MGCSDKRKSSKAKSESRKKQSKPTKRQYIVETPPSQFRSQNQTKSAKRAPRYNTNSDIPDTQPRDYDYGLDFLDAQPRPYVYADTDADAYVDNENDGSNSDSTTRITRMESFNHKDEVSYSSVL